MKAARLPRIVAIDTDPGIDDALALMLAWRSPEVRVELVTTVAGNVPIAAATDNARRVLGLLNPDTWPVLARGAARPLRRRLQTAPWVHGDDGLGGLAGRRTRDGKPLYPPASALRPRPDAPRHLVDLARIHGPALTIVAIGPLTNIARALARAPAIMRRVGRIIVMGGAVAAPGNITPAAEFNFYVDPDAADQVLRAGLPVTLVPLDVTRRVRLTRALLSEHLGGARSPRARAIRDMTRTLIAGGDPDGIALHDPLALALSVDPTLVRTRPLAVAVETRGRHTLGMVVADRRTLPDAPGPDGPEVRAAPVDVAMEVDAARTLALFCARVLAPEEPHARRRAPPGVVVVGSANTDLMVSAPRLPVPGETVIGSRIHIAFGGKGANQAVAARRAGAVVTFVGRLGADEYGRRYARYLREEGINVSGLVEDPAFPSGVALITVDRRGQNQITVAPGANASLAPAALDAPHALPAQAGALVTQLETPLATVEAALRRARERGWRTVLNPAPARTLPRRLSHLVDVLVPNEVEAGVLSGRTVTTVDEARAAVGRLRARGYSSVALTLGQRGVVWADSERVHHLRALPVTARDTTGAGDTFVGYLACALADGRRLADAVAFANTAAGLSVTRPGAQAAIPRQAEVLRRMGNRVQSRQRRTHSRAAADP